MQPANEGKTRTSPTRNPQTQHDQTRAQTTRRMTNATQRRRHQQDELPPIRNSPHDHTERTDRQRRSSDAGTTQQRRPRHKNATRNGRKTKSKHTDPDDNRRRSTRPPREPADSRPHKRGCSEHKHVRKTTRRQSMATDEQHSTNDERTHKSASDQEATIRALPEEDPEPDWRNDSRPKDKKQKTPDNRARAKPTTESETHRSNRRKQEQQHTETTNAITEHNDSMQQHKHRPNARAKPGTSTRGLEQNPITAKVTSTHSLAYRKRS